MLFIIDVLRNVQTREINNGSSSELSNLTRGVGQGDPLSTHLFLLAVEILAIAVREDVDIKGVVIEQEGTKPLLYADDTAAVLSDVDSAYEL